MTGYTVIDFETTGFSPQKHDRVVEVGVVYVDPDGTVGDRWGTLVNPERDMGAIHVHGIRASDVHRAPTFAQIAPHLLRALAGRTLVAHNARFDVAFLEHELQRSGFQSSREPRPCARWSGHGTSFAVLPASSATVAGPPASLTTRRTPRSGTPSRPPSYSLTTCVRLVHDRRGEASCSRRHGTPGHRTTGSSHPSRWPTVRRRT